MKRDAHLGHGGEPALDEDDGFNRLMAMEDRFQREQLARQKALLMKLNRAELRVLAKHFAIPESLTRWCFEAHDYKYGGKEEICEELAERMLP